MTQPSAKSATSFERGLQVLIAIAESGDVSVDELARDLEMPVSTAYRYVRSLKSLELIDESLGRYAPGWRLLQLSGQHLTHARLAEVGGAVLKELVDEIAETAVLTVRVGTQAMCLRQVESPHPIRYAFRINQLLPLHAGAGQRVLLAFAPPPVIQRVLEGPLPRFTGRTHGRDHLLRDLEHVRSTGAAVSHGELHEGAVALAAPVFSGGEIVCSLTIAGPEQRCGEKSWSRIALAALRAGCDKLGQTLDPQKPPR